MEVSMPPPLDLDFSLDDDLPLILDLLGDRGEIGDLLVADQQRQEQSSGGSSRAESGDLEASSSGGQPSTYGQLVALQQQLQQLQSVVQSQIQSMAQQEDPQQQQQQTAVDDMRQTLLHMQGLLSTTQQQQRHQQQHQQLLRQMNSAALAAAGHMQAASPPLDLHAAMSQAGPGGEQPVGGAWHAGGGDSMAPDPPVHASEKRRSSGREGTSKPRQKPHKTQLAELQAQLEAKQAEADALLQRNLMLKRRQRVLGMVIQVREEQMRRLNIVRTKPKELADNYTSFTKNSRSPWTSSLNVEHLKTVDATATVDVHREYIHEVSRLMAQLAQASQQQRPEMAGVATMSLGGGTEQQAGTQQPAVAAAAAAASEARSEAYRQLEELIFEVRELTRYMQLVNPNFQAILYDNGSLTPPPGLWGQVLAAAALREEQKADALVLREIHVSLTAKVYRERRQLASQLQEALAEQLAAPAAAELSALALARDKTMLAMERLHRNVLKERCLLFLTGETFYNTWDVEQMARMNLACYPYKPDEIAMWDELVRQHQMRQLQQMHVKDT